MFDQEIQEGEPAVANHPLQHLHQRASNSTEYNNQTFVYNLCQEIDMDKKDMISLFQEKRLLFKNDYLVKVEKHLVALEFVVEYTTPLFPTAIALNLL